MKCGEIKPLSAFYKHKQMADGYLNKCKECTKKDVSDNYRSNIDHYIEYEHKRSKISERKEKSLEYQKKRRALNKDKYYAHFSVNNAIRDGRLKKQPCEVCGNKNTEAHHDDYSKPLEVKWLCRKHHLEIHNKMSYTA